MSLVHNVKYNAHLVAASSFNIQGVFQEEIQVETFIAQFEHPTESLWLWEQGREKELQMQNQCDSLYKSILRAAQTVEELAEATVV